MRTIKTHVKLVDSLGRVMVEYDTLMFKDVVESLKAILEPRQSTYRRDVLVDGKLGYREYTFIEN